MLLQIEKLDSDRGFRLIGELDASNVDELRGALDPVVTEGGDITLDLRGLAFMDSSGIQILVTTAQGLGERGTLIIVSPGSLVRRLLSLIPVERLENVRIEGDEET
jgi:anti-anti-sigma factor